MLKFDGDNDYVSVNTGVASVTAPFTIEAWLNPASTSGNHNFFDTRSPSEYGFDVKLMNGNQIHADLGDGSGWLTTSADANFNYSANTWIHVAYVVTAEGYTIYANGSEVGSGSLSGTALLYDGSHSINIGRHGGGGEQFNGSIDELRVWNVARTQQQIQDNMNTPFTSTPSGLIHYWQFNEISGTTAHDLAGSTDGTLNNFNFDETDGWRLSTSPLPVELTAFTASAKKNNVELKWTTASETNNNGFEIQRSEKIEGKADTWTKVGFVEGNGTSATPHEYTFADKNVKGKVQYRLKQIDRDGKFGYSQSIEVTVAAPLVFELSQNYPNPFNPATTIEFTIPKDGMTTLKIYNMLGQEVATLVNEELKAGEYHKATFNAGNFASGVYFARLHSGEKAQVKKMMLVK